MSSETIRPCSICARQCDASISQFCSRECDAGAQNVAAFGADIVGQEHTDDKRIFFYDFSFGDLCDLYTTYLCRRIHTEELGKQRVVDRALERVERSIFTKLNRYSPVGPIRSSIAKCIQKLYCANVRIWVWKDAHWKTVNTHFTNLLPFSADEWNELLNAYRLRDSLRRELDRLIEGATMTEKSYEPAN